MSDRFSPEWVHVVSYINQIVASLGSDPALIINAVRKLSGKKCDNFGEALAILEGTVTTVDVPLIVYEAISEVLLACPIPMREIISKLEGIQTSRENERLRPTENGKWQIVWHLHDKQNTPDNYVGLDWYDPSDANNFPLLPEIIIDYVAGCSALYRAGLFLPSTASLLIALEAVIWDKLKTSGHSRDATATKYVETAWEYKILKDNLIIKILDVDNKIESLDAKSPIKQGRMLARQQNLNTEESLIGISVSSELAKFLSSQQIENQEVFPVKGFAEALQRARKGNILDKLPPDLDEVLYRLRNGLIHLSCDGTVNPPVPLPQGGFIENLNDLRDKEKFIRRIISTTLNIINTLYAV